MTKNATLTYEDKSIELPTVVGSEAEVAVDISQLRAKSGLITLDSGYANTGACMSNITFIEISYFDTKRLSRGMEACLDCHYEYVLAFNESYD